MNPLMMKKSCTPNQPLRMIVLAPAQSGWEKSGSLGRKCPCAWKSTTETMAMKRRPSISGTNRPEEVTRESFWSNQVDAADTTRTLWGRTRGTSSEFRPASSLRA